MRDEATYQLTGTTPKPLAGGSMLAPGDTVTLTGEECEQQDNAWLLAEGLLVRVEVEEPEAEAPAEPTPPKRQRRKPAASDTADAETTTDDEATAELPGDDTNGGTDR